MSVDPVAALNLSLAHEARVLLASGEGSDAAVPAVVISGFLGSGKSTLVQHLQRNRGNLKLAVLVNEVGQVDIDSQLLNVKQNSAAVGLAAADLSGGCMCCSKHDQLLAALSDIRSDGHPDYLVLETSGVGDPEVLASALRRAGFRLDSVVTVVDAEAASQSLHLPIAQQQVRLADVVVLNKCDLATLSQVSQLEDSIRSMVPDLRAVVRARFGQVPLPLVLDVQAPGAGPVPDTGPSSTATMTGREGVSAAGAGDSSSGFLSHEAPIQVAGSSLYEAGSTAMGASARRRRVPRLEQQPLLGDLAHQQQEPVHVGNGHGHEQPAHGHSEAAGSGESGGHGSSHGLHQHGSEVPLHRTHAHARLHEGFHTRSVTLTDTPLPLFGLHHFIVHQLLKAPGLLRAKGVVWLEERRRQRFVLHLSGRQRTECCSEAPWDGPPMTQLVFIGTDEQALEGLVAAVAQLARDSPQQQHSGMADALQVSPAAADAAPGSKAAGSDLLASVPAAAPPREQLQIFGAVGRWDPRLELRQVQISRSLMSVAGRSGDAQDRSGGSTVLVEFSAASAPLHGVVGVQVNAELMLAINRTGRAFAFGTRVPGTISAATLMQQADRVASLLLALPVGDTSAWEQVQAAVEPVLRKAFRNVVHCNCDASAH